MRRLRSFALGLVLVAPTLAQTAYPSTPACAAGADQARAALVIGTGTNTSTYCVALDATSVTGIHLIQLAGTQYGLQYRLGFGGAAVCQLEGVGVEGSDCFGGYPDFWGYWHGNGSGGWTWAGSGAASATIGNGDVEGWTWGQGDSGTTHPSPPALAFQDVCEAVAPTPLPTPGGDGEPDGGSGGGDSPGAETNPAGSGSQANASPSGSQGSGSERSPGSKRDGPSGARTQTPVPGPSNDEAPVTVQAAGVVGEATGGSALGSILAVTAIVMLGAAGWLLRRRGDAGGTD